MEEKEIRNSSWLPNGTAFMYFYSKTFSETLPLSQHFSGEVFEVEAPALREAPPHRAGVSRPKPPC